MKDLHLKPYPLEPHCHHPLPLSNILPIFTIVRFLFIKHKVDLELELFRKRFYIHIELLERGFYVHIEPPTYCSLIKIVPTPNRWYLG